MFLSDEEMFLSDEEMFLSDEEMFLSDEEMFLWGNKPILNSFLSDEGPMLERLDYTIRIGSTPTFLYFDLYT